MDDADIIREPLTGDDISQIEHIELMFFAYREFTADADRILDRLAFGRAHHRALYFVNRRPGMTVAELLDILAITKQSLSRVLKQLLDSGHIAQVTGSHDRRQRLLYPTQRGRRLVREVSRPQSARIIEALEKLDSHQRQGVIDFMNVMKNASRREPAMKNPD